MKLTEKIFYDRHNTDLFINFYKFINELQMNQDIFQ